MDELRRGARRAAGDVRSIDERDAEADARRIEGDARTDDARSDDQHVERPERELLEDRSPSVGWSHRAPFPSR